MSKIHKILFILFYAFSLRSMEKKLSEQSLSLSKKDTRNIVYSINLLEYLYKTKRCEDKINAKRRFCVDKELITIKIIFDSNNLSYPKPITIQWLKKIKKQLKSSYERYDESPNR